MKISVTTSMNQLSSQARDSAERMLRSTLARFTEKIAQVSVLIDDENGPRGGVDKHCRVNVLMPGVGVVTTSARHEKVLAAVSEAARRARRIVVSKTKRPQSLRMRRRSHHNQHAPQVD
ncbi:hypothetical protein N9N28_02840 [Rubripirellula amarantea]|uniref:Sigma 54 modulation protein / S30EA ribosomal protein n=1 Tax=Rubripirellula amarantea TaxID=2527999 RepID=A0A5C5WBZ5_9BACT|nr:hypothetical protein [Rubripirellula amarantea]MDA8743548.1 hypothetical protein [Rubripirellula amarantea]TWT48027.1 hypothetical protein Pla22_50270 [Rubripirellula amarantea]